MTCGLVIGSLDPCHDMMNAHASGIHLLFICRWDTEKAQLYADGVLVWEESFGSGGEPICGSGTSSGWSEYKITRDVDLGWVADDTVTLKWTTTLNSAANDESWGLMDVDV